MKDKSELSRRTFLLAGASVLPFFGVLSCAEGRVGGDAGAAEGKACRVTEVGQYGPFYRAGAPWREKLCAADEPGEPLLLAGRVASAGTCEPLKGAVVDVWHASAAGFYDNNDPSHTFDPATFRMRGRTRTDAEGRYQFETILPANYGQGRFVRAKHIHMLITAPGHETLVTECYFEGDKHNLSDGLVRASLIKPLTTFTHEKEKRTYQKVVFDIALAKTR